MAQHHGHSGTSLGGRIDMSRSAAKAIRNRRKRQEKQWAAKSGPTTSRIMTPEERKSRGI